MVQGGEGEEREEKTGGREGGEGSGETPRVYRYL